jgi:preprotein translocase subunit YajC
MLNLINNAIAAEQVTTATNNQSGTNSLLFMLVMFGAFFYFVLWRPQNKRANEHKTLINNLLIGDEVVSTGGIMGKITKITDHYFVLAIANNSTMLIQKAAIASVVPKGTMNSLTN